GEFRGAYAIFRRYRDRLKETSPVVAKLLAKGFDERTDEIVPVDLGKLPWPADAAARETRLRQQLHLQYLELLAEGSTVRGALARLKRRPEVPAARIARYDDDTLLEIALKALTQAYDPFSWWYPPQEWKAVFESVRGEADGIGIALREADGDFSVSSLVPDGP